MKDSLDIQTQELERQRAAMEANKRNVDERRQLEENSRYHEGRLK